MSSNHPITNMFQKTDTSVRDLATLVYHNHKSPKIWFSCQEPIFHPPPLSLCPPAVPAVWVSVCATRPSPAGSPRSPITHPLPQGSIKFYFQSHVLTKQQARQTVLKWRPRLCSGIAKGERARLWMAYSTAIIKTPTDSLISTPPCSQISH